MSNVSSIESVSPPEQYGSQAETELETADVEEWQEAFQEEEEVLAAKDSDAESGQGSLKEGYTEEEAEAGGVSGPVERLVSKDVAIEGPGAMLPQHAEVEESRVAQSPIAAGMVGVVEADTKAASPTASASTSTSTTAQTTSTSTASVASVNNSQPPVSGVESSTTFSREAANSTPSMPVVPAGVESETTQLAGNKVTSKVQPGMPVNISAATATTGGDNTVPPGVVPVGDSGASTAKLDTQESTTSTTSAANADQQGDGQSGSRQNASQEEAEQSFTEAIDSQVAHLDVSSEDNGIEVVTLMGVGEDPNLNICVTEAEGYLKVTLSASEGHGYESLQDSLQQMAFNLSQGAERDVWLVLEAPGAGEMEKEQFVHYQAA